MALLTPLFAFLYHLPQVYKWLLKPYYVASLFMSIAFLAVRKTPGICDHLSTQREDGNPCDFDWVCREKRPKLPRSSPLFSDSIHGQTVEGENTGQIAFCNRLLIYNRFRTG